MGAKMEPKSVPKRGRNLRAKKLALGSLLGRHFGHPGGHFGHFWLPRPAFQNKTVFKTDFGAILAPIWLPKGKQNEAKIDPKTGSKFKSEKVASWKPLGVSWAPLGASWGHLGRLLGRLGGRY